MVLQSWVFEGAIHRGKAPWPRFEASVPCFLDGLCCTEASPEKDWKPIKWDRGDRGKEKTVSNNCDGGINPQPIFARSVPILV